MTFFLGLMILSFSLTSFAYKGDRCDDLRRKMGGFNIVPFLTTSTGQFISSTGECSALGKTSEQERQLFYAINWKFIQNDIARGNGESLTSLLKLSGCNDFPNLPLQKKLKENFEDVFVNDVEKSYNNISPILDRHCKNV